MKEWPTYVQAVTETRRKRKPKLPVCFQLFLFLNSPDFRACPWKHHSDWSQGCSPRDGDVISYTEREKKKKHLSTCGTKYTQRYFKWISLFLFYSCQHICATANLSCHGKYLSGTVSQCVSLWYLRVTPQGSASIKLFLFQYIWINNSCSPWISCDLYPPSRAADLPIVLWICRHNRCQLLWLAIFTPK